MRVLFNKRLKDLRTRMMNSDNKKDCLNFKFRMMFSLCSLTRNTHVQRQHIITCELKETNRMSLRFKKQSWVAFLFIMMIGRKVEKGDRS